MICRYKSNFIRALEELDHKASRVGDGKIVEKIAEIFSKITVGPCTPNSTVFWTRAVKLVKELNNVIESDRGSVRRTLEKVSKKVEEVIEWEKIYLMKLVLVMIPLPFSLAIMVPITSPLDAGIYFAMMVNPFYASLMLLAISLISAIKNPLSLIVTALTLVSMIDYKKELRTVELRIEKLEQVSYEELKRIFEKMYGKEGEEILRYEIDIRMAKGMEFEEALNDIKKTLSQVQ